MPARLALRHRLMSIAVTSVVLNMVVARHPARAQSADAEALFNDGIKLLAEGKVAQACAAFHASNRVEPRAGTLIRLADCLERNHQLASAWSAYKDALTRVKDPRKRAVAMAKAAAIEPRLSHLTVAVADDSRVEGLIVTRNGEAFDPALWNRALPVDGGDYVIAGRAPDHEEWQITVHVPAEGSRVSAKVPRLKELSKAVPPFQRPLPPSSPASPGTPTHVPDRSTAPDPAGAIHPATSIRPPDRDAAQDHEVAVKPPESVAPARAMPPAPSAPAADPPPPRERIANRRWAAWKPWVAVGAGVGVVAVGGVIDVFAANNFNAYDSGFAKLSCATMGCTRQQVDQSDPSLRSRLSRAQTEQQIAVGGFIAGGAAIAAGVVLVYLNQPRQTERDNPRQSAPNAAIVPVVSPDLVGVVVTVSR